jgi:hypothetical protein
MFKLRERQRYEKALRLEKERKMLGLNLEEKRAAYHKNIECLPAKVYDKAKINDTQINFNYILDKHLYNKGKRAKGWWRRMLVRPPTYFKHEHTSSQVPVSTWIMRVVGSLVMAKFGYEFGILEAEMDNRVGEESKVVEFEAEE